MNRIFTFYTKDTPYEQEARELCLAFNTFDTKVTAIPYETRGDWMMNALARATMLEGLRLQYPADVLVLLDADIRPVKDPRLLHEWRGDVACEDRGARVAPNRRYSAGVLLFGPTVNANAVLVVWAAMCRADKRPRVPLREQLYLHDCLEAFKGLDDNPLNVTNIGNNHNRKPEDVRSGDDTVLVHHVASRRLLKTIGGAR